MKVIDISKDNELLIELALFLSDVMDKKYEAKIPKNVSNFCQEILTADKLIASGLKSFNFDFNTPQAQQIGLYLATIAANSPTLKEVDFSKSVATVKIAEALAKSTSIENIDMSWSHLGNIGVDVAKALAKSTSIKSVDFSFNMLDNHAPEVIEAFTTSSSIEQVKMSTNGPGFLIEITDKTTLDKMTTLIQDHNQDADNFKVAKQTHMLSDSLHDPLIEIIGEYAGHHIDFQI